MRVATIQEAIEGAPSIIQPDGNGGVFFALVTDEGIGIVVDRICDREGWNDEERQGLYEAVIGTLEELVAPESVGESE